MLPDLASNWTTRPLGEVCDLIMGQAPKGNSYNDKGIGTSLIAGAADLGPTTPKPKKWTNAPTKIGKQGDIILCVRATIGDLNWADKEYCYGRGVAGIRVNGQFDPELIWFWLKACKEHLLSLGRGATFKQISKTDIASLPVPDLDIAEQRRIVARIKECMERVEEIEGLRAEAREEADHIFRSHCAEIFSSDWPEIPVKDLISEKPSNGIFKRRKDFGSGVLLANVKNLYGDQVIHPDELERIEASNKEIEKYRLNPGDVLVNRSSLKREGTGRSCVFEGYSEPVLFECHIMKVTPRLDRLHPHLFAAFMNSPLGLSRILMRAKTATMTTWNQTDLQSIQIPTPPLELQEGLVEELANIKALADQVRAEFENGELQFMRESILRKAFAGEL